MTAIDLASLTIRKVHESLMIGEYSVVDLAKAYLEEIKKKNADVNAYLEVYDDVIAQAEAADERIKAGNENDNFLIGIPFAIKDNILIKGRRVGAASKILEGYVGSYDATAISKLKEKGVVFVGRTNMDEFAMGGSTENSAYGVTKNPHDSARVSGGSSGGSAAAVAMRGALVSLGSDTGGSVRQPGSFCGAVGLKPTYGSVSRHGLMAMGSSLDVIGTLANNVDDVEIIFNSIKGTDKMDSTSFYPQTLEKKSSGKIGIIKGLLDQGGISESVKKNFEETVSKLKGSGYDLVEVEIPRIAYSLAVYYIIMPAEVSSNMARFDGVKYGLHEDGANLLEDYLNTRGDGFGREVRRRIILGTYVLSSGYYDAYYDNANRVRNALRADFEKAFETVDAILTPTAPSPAFKVGEKVDDPLAMYLEDIFTVTANLIGAPAISVPSGFDGALPLGTQIIAPHYREDTLFEIGREIERSK